MYKQIKSIEKNLENLISRFIKHYPNINMESINNMEINFNNPKKSHAIITLISEAKTKLETIKEALDKGFDESYKKQIVSTGHISKELFLVNCLINYGHNLIDENLRNTSCSL